jgi:flagellar biosynthesis protein FlhB
MARLWSEGATPASRALVGGAVVTTAWLLAFVAGPFALEWCTELVRSGFAAAASPACPQEVAAGLLLRGALPIAMIALTLLAVALLAQMIQRGPRPTGSHIDLAAGRHSSSRQGIDALQIMRAVLMLALAAAAVAGTVCAVVGFAPELLRAEELQPAVGGLVAEVAWPLLLVLVGAAILDAVIGRVAWRQVAWMSRCEVEHEVRQSEGHPLTRLRRDATMRGR